MSIYFNATTSKLENGGATGFNVAEFTILGWAYGDSLGELSTGCLIALPEGGTSPRISWHGVANTMRFFYNWSSGGAEWTFPCNTGQWNAIALSYDRGSTSNVPVARVNFSNVTVTEVTPPSGTAVAPSAGYCVGNITGQTRTWDGRIQDIQFFNRILSDSEKDQALKTPGSVTSGLVLWLKMRDGTDRFDYSSSPQNGTATDLATGAPAPMHAVPAGVAITGNAAELKKGYKLVATTGSLTIGGQNCLLFAGYSIGPESPSVATNNASSGTDSWSGASNVLLDDTSRATSSSYPSSQYLVAEFNDIVIESNATVTGVVFNIKKSYTTGNPVFDEEIFAVIDGNIDSFNFARPEPWIEGTANEMYYQYYMDAELIGLTPEVINDLGFGIAIRTSTTVADSLALVNHVTATIYYTLPVEYILAADTGSITITGNPANFLRNYVLQAQAGSVSIVGNDAGLYKGYKLEASAGSVAITGNDVNFIRLYSVNAELGTVGISGNSANLLHNKILSADTGVVAITGNDASLLTARHIDCDTGVVDIIGNDAALSRTRVLQATTGTVLINGSAADLFVTSPGNYTLPASPGEVDIVGSPATLLHHRVLVAETGTVSIVGNDVNLIENEILNAETGTVVITGNDATLLKTSRLNAELGTLAITGNVVQFLRTYRLVCETEAVGISGNAATFRYNRVFQCDTGAVSIVCNPADLYTASDLRVARTWKSVQRLNAWNSSDNINTWKSKKRDNCWN